HGNRLERDAQASGARRGDLEASGLASACDVLSARDARREQEHGHAPRHTNRSEQSIPPWIVSVVTRYRRATRTVRTMKTGAILPLGAAWNRTVTLVLPRTSSSGTAYVTS